VGQVAAEAFVVGTAAQDADDRLIYDPVTGILYYDADGSGVGARIAVAKLGAGTTVQLDDLWVGG